ncbi:MAG: nucleotidyltransferase family protein [Bryobacterales bacterium]|nr:nucleotidyltransferase family protein [Bryobacteraceae bacterium]MDW8355542.1 nucleotidyltransferase family protein [Bryobacterales bacterium]
MKLAALILAAGESRRMGAPKALLPLAGETFLDRLIAAFEPWCCPVVVVTGHDAERIQTQSRRASEARFVRNHEYRLGQLSSLQCGLRAVPADCDGVLFTPVDYPAIQPATIARLAERFARRRLGELLVIPRCEGRRGHPVACARELFPEFLSLPPEAQAREVIRRHREETVYVDVEDPGILEDADDLPAYERLKLRFGAL